MLLVELTYEGEQGFIKDVYNIKNKFEDKKLKIGIVESMENKTHFIKIFCDDEHYEEKIKNSINLYISKILYKTIVNIFRKKELFEYLTDTYFFLNHKELFDLENTIIKELYSEEKIGDNSNFYCINLINSMVDKIKKCIEENGKLNIDGFIRFRSKDLAKDIQKVVDKAIEKYMVEKEYNEFIKLLKYFVDIQEPKINIVNLIPGLSNDYDILDEDGNNIYDLFINELLDYKANDSINIEDIIVSGLITNSPKNIIVHNKELCINKEFIETISKVFGDRLSYCENCDLCKKNKINKSVDNKFLK